jgi:hypothetical protein
MSCSHKSIRDYVANRPMRAILGRLMQRDAEPMTGARYADVLQCLVIDLLGAYPFDVVCLERIGILVKTNQLQTFPNLSHGSSCFSP